jgi:quercetin dioxygenase-like cupin family protein
MPVLEEALERLLLIDGVADGGSDRGLVEHEVLLRVTPGEPALRYSASHAEHTMNDFPAFMKHPLNRIASSSQYTDDIEGYVFDGADGSQAAFWTCDKDRVSKEHAHDFDEYVLVVKGRCTVIIEGQRMDLLAGDEFLVPKGTLQSMEVAAGTRTVHVFGGKRAHREQERQAGVDDNDSKG